MRLSVIFWVLVALLLAYEAWAVVAGKGDTISEIVWHVSAGRPVVPFVVGLVCGHWFWPRRSDP